MVKGKTDSEPAYKRWATIVATLTAVASLGLNVWQATRNAELARKIQERQASPDIEARYFVVSGMPLFDVRATETRDSAAGPLLMNNKVLTALEPWKERWESGEPMLVDDYGVQRAHGILFYKVSNRGKEAAQLVTLLVRAREFPIEGAQAEDVWALNPASWKTDTLRLADLRTGESVLVPLAHLLGTQRYFGTVMLPIEIRWYNPALQREETAPAGPMAPEEQWLSQGLNVRVAQ